MNFNNWFYSFHKYRTSKRNGEESFTDTKSYNINERFKRLVEMESALIAEQPDIVVGNNKGFDMLLDLMGRSNYTFEDLDKSLSETYRVSLQNAMSRNMVNTHAVIFNTNINDKNAVTGESFTNYKIIDAPFNQLHFGHRDEFIRQRIHEMHITENNKYLKISEFNNSRIADVLDFCIICSVNGFISNDAFVAIDDHGFKFKVAWKSTDVADFIVYKLDRCKMYSRSIPASYAVKGVITYADLGINKSDVNGMKCLLNIHNTSYDKSVNTVPNFGYFNESGLIINNTQDYTVNMINNGAMTEVSIDIYTLKYFHEVPNIFPAVNYYDIMETKLVYDDKYEKLRTPDGSLVVESSISSTNELEICTPPITIDRDTSFTFDTIVSCLSMYKDLMEFKPLMTDIGRFTIQSNPDMAYYMNTIRPRLYELLLKVIKIKGDYYRGAIITSLVPNDKINKFDKLAENISNFYYEVINSADIQTHTFDELYGNNYENAINDICEPFMNDKLLPFSKAINIQTNFYDKEDATRFNRPVSEQSFITLKYSQEYNSWLLAYPKIRHFHGIGNTFYINEGLSGNEIFKFFVLYTDTEDPTNPNIEHFDLDTVVDFDLFYDEMLKYNGCIRYWDAESRLAKISKMLYRKYNDETVIHVLSKILKRKIDGESIISLYPSDINYEMSNTTSDNIKEYTEDSDRGPFSINFLFYTLSLLNNNVDKLQAYFYRDLTKRKFSNRYADVNISSVLSEERYPIKYSQYTIAPTRYPTDTVFPQGHSVIAFYGIPLLKNGSGIQSLYDPYRYVLNVYDPDTSYPFIDTDGVHEEYHVHYDDISVYSGAVISYTDTIEFCRLLTTYLDAVYDYTSEIQTNYKTTYNMSSIADRARDTIDVIREKILELDQNGNIANITVDGLTTADIINMIRMNAFVVELNEMKNICENIIYLPNETPPKSFVSFITARGDGLIGILKYVYYNFGFDDDVKERVRRLYIHLKKINKPMNAYQYKKWLDGIDLHILETLDQHTAYNPNNTYSDQVFNNLYEKLSEYIETVTPYLESLDTHVKALDDTFHTSYIRPYVRFCEKIYNDIIFDIFTYSSIDIPNLYTSTYNDKPFILVIKLPDGDPHMTPPFGVSIPGDHHLFFKLNAEQNGNNYVVKSFASICEYIFFDGSDLSNLTAYVLSDSGTVLDTISSCEMTFIRAGSTADKGGNVEQISNTETTVLDFEDHHESFEIGNDGKILNELPAPVNYEMLIGNHYTQLDHESEYILNPNTWNPGSVDRIFIENQVINRMIIADHGHKECSHMFFKPCQILHPDDSVNGKYFEGETVYIKALDGKYVFPAKITSVDHSMNKGFMEAEVDQWNAKWFNVEDPVTFTDLMEGPIECEVIDDSIRNFLDEYSDTELNSYYEPTWDTTVMDVDHVNCYTLPGDPLTVTSDAPYVYSRLKWMFNEDIDNRFIDEALKTYRFIYVGEGFVANNEDTLQMNLINHNFNNKSLPEQYPVLKFEPNEHLIWRREIETFTSIKEKALGEIRDDSNTLSGMGFRLANDPTLDPYTHRYEYTRFVIRMDELRDKIKGNKELVERMNRMIYQLEGKTTWYNVISRDAALIYIDNGAADKFSPTFIPNIRDLLYTDKISLYLYDWEHKLWMNPSSYTVSYNIEDDIKIDECDDYTTNRVMTSITITPTDGFSYSNKILVYFAYNKSDIFDNVLMNSNKCMVKFKPVLVLDKEDSNHNPYLDIRIRKQFDGYEKYSTTTTDAGEIIIKRIRRSGKYTDAPTFRLCDITVSYNDTDYTYQDIRTLKVKSPFTGLTTQRTFHQQTCSARVVAPIDSFAENEHIKLICISNNDLSMYDGNISSVAFEGTTLLNDGNQIITVTNSTLPNYISGEFVCTVFKDDSYDSCGGVVVVDVTSNEESIYDEWVTVPTDYMLYRELPEEFMIIMNNVVQNTNVIVTLENKYIKDYDDTIAEDNSGLHNPFEYYYDTKNQTRLPISDVKRNAYDRRLVIDTTANPDVKVVKTPYIGICRYSLAKIPADGVIDMTGYLPTPLSRDRYEFWVNGRYVTDPKDLLILSPTSIQLRNMKSLKNFECVELVDDVDTDNDLMHKGNVYIDINGNTYSNFKLAMLSNANINKQRVAYIFNANNHEKINDYYRNITDDPNNYDLEIDILSTVTFDTSDTDYNKLYNIPTINGVSLFHPKLSNLGIAEIDNMDIIKLYDKIWHREATTDPLFFNTHRMGSNITNEKAGLTIHAKQIDEEHWHGLDIDTSGMYLIHVTGPSKKYFSLYVSRTEDGVIDDILNTVKIIPFMSTSVYILLDDTYHGMWLHSTYPNTDPIHII